MTSQDKDIETIRAMLNKCVVFAASDNCEEGALEESLNDFSLVEATEALEAFDRLIERTLPELPNGYEIRTLREISNKSWLCEIEDGFGEMKDKFGNTPRAAVLAALEKIGK